jgi:uncharacterized sodium:solute symporter family permease YidK
MIITIAFLACAVACASMFRHTDRLNEKFGFIIHWLVTIAGVASAALGGVHAGHPVSPTVARVSLVAFAAVLALGVGALTVGRGVSETLSVRPPFTTSLSEAGSGKTTRTCVGSLSSWVESVRSIRASPRVP